MRILARLITLLVALITAFIPVISGTPAVSAGTTYTQTLDIYVYAIGDINPDPSWTHQYDGSAWPAASVTLTIVADDVDLGEQDEVFINGNSLGYLNTMPTFTNWSYHPGPGNPLQSTTTTTFEVPPGYLDSSIPARVVVGTMWGVEIETSTLTVVSGGSATEIDIDIKPWSNPNSINTKVKNGVIPVAILGTETLDVENIDYEHLELNFGPELGIMGAVPAHDNTKYESFQVHIIRPETQDPDKIPNSGDEYPATANDDLIPDLVLHFKVSDTVFTSGDGTGYLWGRINGINIYGSDSVNIVN